MEHWWRVCSLVVVRHRLAKIQKKLRKSAIDTMFENMKKSMLPDRNPIAFISHGDCIDDANYLAERVKNELGIPQVEINYVGPVIGSHSGPGTLALFFLGKER